MKLLDLDLIHARRGLLAKEFSCEEYATELVAHTQKHMDLHGWAEFDPQALLQAARTMDQKGIATDAHNRLGGVPLGVKDNIDVMGMRSTAGTGALADRKPTADAGVISAVKSDGALIAGKTI